jgi:glycosyltransferase involved in cell wall biosynthesis
MRHLPDSVDVTYGARFVATDPGNLGLDYAAREPYAIREFEGVPVSTVVPRAVAVPGLALSRRLVHHRSLHRVAVGASIGAWRPSLRSAIGPRPSVVHVIGCGRELLGYTALAEAKRHGVPFTIFPAAHIGSWGDSDLDLDLYKRAQAVFTATSVERDHFERLGVSGERLFVCPFAPDVACGGDGSRFRHAYGLGDRPIVLFVGRKARSKGYHDLREAMRALEQRVPRALLVAIGADTEPPYPDVPESLVLDLGTADDRLKSDALAACNVMCLPSDSESFGIVYVEAWSYAKPVIALDTPASRALIDDRVNGILAPDRHTGLVEALTRVLSDPNAAAAMGKAGNTTYHKCYTWEAAIKIHMQVFATVLRRACG